MRKVFLILSVAWSMLACNSSRQSTSSSRSDTTSTISEAQNAEELFGWEWKLIELNNSPIKIDTVLKKEPMVAFNKDSEQLTGNGGCNRFGGSFKRYGRNGIQISIGAATMMACPNLALENTFMEVLKQAKSYSVDGKILWLKDQNGKNIAKLEGR